MLLKASFGLSFTEDFPIGWLVISLVETIKDAVYWRIWISGKADRTGAALKKREMPSIVPRYRCSLRDVYRIIRILIWRIDPSPTLLTQLVSDSNGLWLCVLCLLKIHLGP